MTEVAAAQRRAMTEVPAAPRRAMTAATTGRPTTRAMTVDTVDTTADTAADPAALRSSAQLPEPGRDPLAPALQSERRDGLEIASSYDEAMDFQRRTVLMIEDEDAIVAPLTESLAREGFAPVAVGTIAEGLQIARTDSPDLVLLDVMLPDGSGFDALRELRSMGSTPVIMLTARGDEADRVAGLELGADDYVIKPFSARELVARIRAVLRRVSTAADPPSRDAIRIGAVELDPAARTATFNSEPLELTRKEFDLLALLMGHAGSVVTRERLIDEVWDVNWFGSTKTLDVHVSGLRKKLGDDPTDPRYLHTVRGIGFRFAQAGEDAGRVRVRARGHAGRARDPLDAEFLAPRGLRDPLRGERRGARDLGGCVRSPDHAAGAGCACSRPGRASERKGPDRRPARPGAGRLR
jgi:DNA-binding response OmpR family regulator